MDHFKTLARAWSITWRYRVLWIFGFLLALAGGGGGGNGGGGGGAPGPIGGGPSRPGGGVPGQMPNLPFDQGTFLAIVVVAAAVILLLVVAFTILRYVAETALIAGVDEIEETGQSLTVRRGFRLGWSRQALRLFLADLAVTLPVILGALLLAGLAALPLLLLLLKVDALNIVAWGLTATLGLSALLVILVVVLVISIVKPYIQRRIVLARQGVIASIRQALALLRHSMMDTGLMWLLLVAVGIAWAIVSIPIILLLVALALMIGGLPAGAVYLASHAVWPAVILGGALFLLALIPAISFVEGLFLVYLSSAWTLTYRQVLAGHTDLFTEAAAAG